MPSHLPKRSRQLDERILKTVPSLRQGPLPSLTTTQYLSELTAPHVLSFNGLLESGLFAIVSSLPARNMTLANNDRLSFWLEEPRIDFPLVSGSDNPQDNRLLPAECRERTAASFQLFWHPV